MDTDSLLGHAMALLRSGRPAQASLAAAAAVDPGRADGATLLGINAAQTGRPGEAARWLRRAARLAPLRPGAMQDLAVALLRAAKADEARRVLRSAATVEPGSPAVWGMLADLRTGTDSTAELERSVRLAPGDRARHLRLADLLELNCRFEAAVEQCRIAQDIAATPDIAVRLILLLNLAEAPPEATLDAARAWATRFADPLAAPRRVRDPDPERLLRVGYLCPLVSTQAPIYMPVIRAHDRRVVEVILYIDAADARAVQGAPPYWDLGVPHREVGGLDHAALADRIREDGIDILVDGLGFPTAGSRLLTLARRPAPIQVHFPVMTTTGMSALDGLLADPVLVPPGEEPLFHEAIRRLPCGYHFAPPADTLPEVRPPPLRRNGHVTFGSFNQIVKIRPRLLDAWGEILRRVPDARLVIKAFDLQPHDAAAITDRLTAQGVARGRIDVLPPTASHRDHLALFGEIDIHLDTTPYNGVTTTAEALWMGVPVVALAGRRILERYSATMLHQVGLERLAPPDLDGYVAAACRLAGAPDELEGLRASLRDRMARSRLGDSARFTRDLEAAYRGLWRELCRRPPDAV
jgi:protein O-GlcNAc transferase